MFNPFRRKKTTQKAAEKHTEAAPVHIAYEMYVNNVRIAEIADELEMSVAEVLDVINKVESNRG